MSSKHIRGVLKSTPLDADAFDPATGELNWICANKAIVDRGGDIIESTAWPPTLPSFLKLGTMLLYHDTKRPVGRWTSADARSDGLYLRGVVGSGWKDADEARAMIRDGAVRAVSVGFNPRDGFRDKSGAWHYTQVSLLEVSLVTIPMNQEATFSLDNAGTLKSVEFDRRAESRQPAGAYGPRLKREVELLLGWLTVRDLQRDERLRNLRAALRRLEARVGR